MANLLCSAEYLSNTFDNIEMKYVYNWFKIKAKGINIKESQSISQDFNWLKQMFSLQWVKSINDMNQIVYNILVFSL